uniref:Uncharacterized protein n=1 Tax=Anguilla anguilla TaxID=7936 RepID=A0A0E9SXA6_ANGAN
MLSFGSCSTQWAVSIAQTIQHRNYNTW